MPRVYLETSVVSYLTARPSRNEVTRVQQRLTRKWWRNDRGRYDIFTSRLIIEESSAGNAKQAGKRLNVLAKLPILELTDEAIALAEYLTKRGVLPEKASADAAHMAIATVHGMEFLLTWNCKHLANAHVRQKIEQVCRDASYSPALICTPQELTEVEYD